MTGVKLKEWLWVGLFAALVMALTSIPYLIGVFRSNDAWRFSGFVLGVEDGNSYLANMQQGAHGQWLFRLPYAVEEHAPSLIYIFYILLGKLIGWIVGTEDILRLHSAVVLGFHLVRVFWGVGLLLMSYQFLAELLPHIRQRRLALILVGLGGGLGWLLLALHAPGQPLEFYSPEAFTFLDLFALPHLSASRVFFLAGLLFYLWAVRKHWAWVFASGAMWFIMTLIQPLYMLIVFAILAMHIMVLTVIAFRQSESELIRGVDLGGAAMRALWVAATAASVGLPMVAYTFLLFSIEPIYQIWGAQNIILSPEWWHYLSAWGLLVFAGWFGLRPLYRRNVSAWALVVGWLLILPGLVYLPYNLQRRLAEGAQLPLVALAVSGLSVGLVKFFRWRLKKRLRQIASALLIALCVPTTAMLYVGALLAARQYSEPIYQTKDQVAAYVFLARSLPPRAAVLSSFEFGNALPAYGYMTAFMGHGPETPNLGDKRATAASLYNPTLGSDERYYSYSLIGAPYMIIGPHEQATLGKFDPGNPRQAIFLQKIFDSGEYSIWSLKIGLGSGYWPELMAALAPVIVFWRLILGGQVLYWALPALQFVPWRVLVNSALREGHLPLWTPLLGMGAPLMANLQSAVFYPPNWLALLLPPEFAISILAVLHLSFAGVGMVRLARRLGLKDFSAAIVGLSFCLAGYVTARLWFITINNAIAWLPWMVLASDSLASASERRPPVKQALTLSALIALQLLAGHAQSSFYTLLIAGVWTVWQSLIRTRSVTKALPAMGWFGLAVAFALCLTAIQVLPTYELLRQSPRADAAAYEFAMTYSLWPWRFFTFLAPNFFGHPADHNYWGYATYWEDDAYMGLLPLAFALYVAYGLWRKRITDEGRRTTAIFLFALAVVSVLLALGQNTPLYPFFYFYVPGFKFFQAPARLLIGYTFALSLLAGIGAEVWEASPRKRYWARLGIAGSLAAAALGLVGTMAITDEQVVTFASGLAGAAIIAAGVFLLILTQPDSPNRWQWVTLVFLSIDLGLAAVRLNPTTDPALYQLSPTFTVTEGRVFQYQDDERQVKFTDFFRFKSFDDIPSQVLHDSLLSNLNVLSNLPSVNNFDPLLPARYVRYLEALETSPRLLDLADVRTVIKPGGRPEPRAGHIARLRVVYQARLVSEEAAALAAVTAPTFDPDSEVILEATETVANGLALDPNRFTAEVNLEGEGYVVLSDTFYPGWRVFVDGEPRPLLHADYVFRAVAVPAGQHTVTFEYAPLSVTVGLLVSSVAIVLWIVVWLAAKRQA